MVIKTSSAHAGASGRPEVISACAGGSRVDERRNDVAERQSGGANGASAAAGSQRQAGAGSGAALADRSSLRQRVRRSRSTSATATVPHSLACATTAPVWS